MKRPILCFWLQRGYSTNYKKVNLKSLTSWPFFFNTTTTPNMKPKKWVQNPLSLHNPVKQVQTCWEYNVLVMVKNKNQIIHIASPKRVLFTHWSIAKLWYMPYFVCMDSFYTENFFKYLISHNKYLEQWTLGYGITSYRSAQLSLSTQIFY